MATTTAADFQKAIAKNERYAANYRAAGKDPARYVAKIAALKAGLAALSAPKSAAQPVTLSAPKAAAVAQVAVAPQPATGGPLTQAHIDAAYAHLLDAEDVALKAQGKPYGRDGAPRGALTPQEIHDLAVKNGVVRDIAAMGLLGDPGTFPDVDYSGYTHFDSNENLMRLWIAGKLVAEAPVSTDVLGWANAQAAKYGVKF